MQLCRQPVFQLLLVMHLLLPACNSGKDDSRWSTRQDSVIEADSTLAQTKQPTFQVLDRNLHNSAESLLLEASTSDDPLLRANAIEGLQPSEKHLDEVVRSGLVDENEGVRFVATMTIGLEKLCSLSHLVRPMLSDPSSSVHAAAIFSLTSCGEETDLNPLASMVLGTDPTAKANASFILGELGNSSAIPLIRNGVGRHEASIEAPRAQAIDLIMAEAMVKLGDEEERQVIQAALFAPPERAELTALACQMIGRLRDQSMAMNLETMALAEGPRKPGPEIQLLAADALAKIDPDRVPVEIVVGFISHERPEIRSQAAMVLGSLGSSSFSPQLSTLLHDQDPRVQVAAAAAILRLGDSSVARSPDEVY